MKKTMQIYHLHCEYVNRSPITIKKGCQLNSLVGLEDHAKPERKCRIHMSIKTMEATPKVVVIPYKTL